MVVVEWLEAPADTARTWGRASARLGPGRVRRRCLLNPGGGVPARRGDAGLCALPRRPPFARPWMGTGRNGDCVWSCAFQPPTCRGMGRNQGCGTCEAPGPWRPRGLLGGLGADLGRPLWLRLVRWAGLRFCRQPAFGAALPRRAKKTPVVFTGAWFLEKIRGRAGGLTGLVRDHSPRNRRSSDSNSATWTSAASLAACSSSGVGRN